jgi:hypothetical protein
MKLKRRKIQTYTVVMDKSLFILPNIWVTWNHLYVSVSFGWLKWTYDIDFFKKK